MNASKNSWPLRSRLRSPDRNSQVTGIAGDQHIGVKHVAGGSHVQFHLGHEGAIGRATQGVVECHANISHDGDVFTPRAFLTKYLDHLATKEFVTPWPVEFQRYELL